MPLAMLIGGLFYRQLGGLSGYMPFLIALMLFITFCNISLKEIRFSKLHLWLLLIQLVGSLSVYGILFSFDRVWAQGVMICVLAPTATSAVVITGMLGGNVAGLTAFSLLSNLLVVFAAPVIFAFIGESGENTFFQTLEIIFRKVFLILLFPFLIAVLLRKTVPAAARAVVRVSSVSFYLWCIALITATAGTVRFIISQENPDYKIELLIAGGALIVCVSQFLIGRRLGRIYNDTVAGGQGLGQKNTILAIWMAQTYLHPISSIGPGTYILWQNIINSYQVWRKSRKND
jgi:Predicted Na+-dependent transporter